MDVYNLREMWGALLLRGVFAILFGIAAVFWPGLTLATFVYLFAAYIIATGLLNQIIGLTNVGKSGGSFWSRIFLILLGILEVGVGVYLFRHPLVTFGTLVLLVGATLIVWALFELFAGIFGNGNTETHRTVLVVSGLVTGAAGIIMLFQPARSGIAFVWVLGLYALITGPLTVAVAFEAKRLADEASGAVKVRR
jgi:uncharacterized membrane protein HdeD (DUF308 family)